MRFDLNERKIIITGIDGFLGQHLQKALLEEGAHVIGVDIVGGQFTEKLDVSDSDAVSNFATQVKSKYKEIYGIINCGAVSHKGKHLTSKQITETLETNVHGPLNMIEKLAPIIVEGGAVVNVASIYGIISPDFRIYDKDASQYNSVAYGASKAALLQANRTLAVQLSPRIRVNAVSPGGILGDQSKKFIDAYSSRVPIGRLVDPKEVVNAILFLLSPLSSGMIGQNLIVDGGLSIW